MVSLTELLLLAAVLGTFLALGVGGVVLLLALVRGTQRKTDMGINLTPARACPKCGAPLPSVRAPKNLRQFLWGGWTCRGCGAELDKWGRVLA